MGDAVHRHPPSNGLGPTRRSRTPTTSRGSSRWWSRGTHRRVCSDSYSVERAPIGKQIVDRANKSIGEFGPILGALGLLDSTDPAVMKANMEARKEDSAESKDRRRKLREAIAYKVYEFDAHGVEIESVLYLRRGRRGCRRRAPRRRGSGARLPAVVVSGDALPARVAENDRRRSRTRRRRARAVHAPDRHRRVRVARGRRGDRGRGFPIRSSTSSERGLRVRFGDWARASEIEDDWLLLVRRTSSSRGGRKGACRRLQCRPTGPGGYYRHRPDRARRRV